MIRKCFFAVLMASSLLCSAQRNSAAQQKTESAHALAITHVTVIDVTAGTTSPDQTVIIIGNKISERGLATKVIAPKNAKTVDGRGKYLIPGLWDMHVHMAGFTADAHWSAPLLGVMLAHGITGMRDMGGSLPDLKFWRAEIEAGRMAGPQIVASGPALDGKEDQPPAILAADTPQTARNSVTAIRTMGGDFVKILNNIPKDAYMAIASSSKEQGLTFVGHIPPEVSAAEASDAGQKSIEHMEGIQLGCSSKEEELRKSILEAQAKRDRAALGKAREEMLASYSEKKCQALFDKFRQNGTWQAPTQVWTRINATLDKADPSDPELAFLPASVTREWTLDKTSSVEARKVYGIRFENGRKFVKMMHTAGVGLLAGSDSIDPYVFTGSALHEELAIFVEDGLTPAQALQTATTNPAKFFGRDDLGKIARGKIADLVLLDADPLKDIHNTSKINGVFRNGKYYDRAALDKLLDDARHAAATYKPM